MAQSLITNRIQRLAIASNNAGKIKEYKKMFAPLAIDLHTQNEFTDQEAEETASSFVENALLKARHLAIRSNLPTLADDSGLCVPELNLSPGVKSARYAGSHGDTEANIDKLLKDLSDGSGQSRRAFFYCSLVLLRQANDPVPIIAQAQWSGSIALQRQGDGGFGYDPIFLPDEQPNTSAAQLQPSEKNRISHRGKALQQLLAQLNAL